MKRVLIILVVAFMVSCSGSESESEIREEIKAKKVELNNLKKEIHTLENELAGYVGEDSLKDLIPVKTQKLKPQTFRHFFESSGVVEAVEEAYISPEMGGQIKEIYVDEGDQVKQGQLLARLNTSVTESTIEEVETSLELATTVYKKQKTLWKEKNIGSEIQYLEAKTNKESLENKLQTLRAQMEMSIIRSPIHGIVDQIFQKEGELATPGMQMMQVINLDKLYVNIDISERYLPNISKGDSVRLSFPSYPGKHMTVPIHRIGNVIEPDNRTFKVELKIDNVNERYKPNMVAITKINDYTADSAIVVPSIVVKEDLTGKYLYVLDDKNETAVAEKKYIETGRSYNNKTLITKGLRPGMEVIIAGFNQVSNGSEVYVKEDVE
ncbi:MAG: efflux RND transporter periplasmic adaptor subunit [Bacteroidales bacterium]|nr:efflux RND transporter periplasmic adaptor subunit [Bacteroidales bacterium]MCF8343152.1 efflux RND transporter periplasmic adaptor subunit [Bacteroidales bacterium]MCF8350354.1 efflux RND transporter periplasmic adaptor subunit [Bacteroidales bacterium]MCF8376486.1 efflux RND transporter periplasmic adaptor subunit [Bacteroidales bacterium]MCF8401488.1 efflux RND transporter periplasmic adaptor subunit [Bacteroidales bacterium]